MPDTDGIGALARARARVLERIADACARAGRDPAGVTLVAVSKTVEAARLRNAVAAGLTVLAENRVQEALGKVGEVPGAEWHLVGPLQSNKARRAVETFALIQTVDSVTLAQRLDRIAGDLGRERIAILVQVNVDADPAKAGVAPADVPRLLDAVASLRRLEIRGLMTIGRQVADEEGGRRTFAALRQLSDRLRPAAPQLGPELSMGMSDDFPVAVEEGATLVRVGRALFGERPHAHDADPAAPTHIHR